MLNSVFSGIFISIGGIAFLKSGGFAPIFCSGIVLCALFAERLCTRVIPLAMRGKYSVADCVKAWFGNLIGAVVTGIAACHTRSQFYDTVKNIVDPKISDNFLSLFILAIGCGMLVAFGTYAYARFSDVSKALAIFFLAFFITAFVYAGFEHIVADMFYLTVYVYKFGWTNSVFHILVSVTGGNVAGAFLAHLCTRAKKSPAENSEKVGNIV